VDVFEHWSQDFEKAVLEEKQNRSSRFQEADIKVDEIEHWFLAVETACLEHEGLVTTSLP